MTTFWTYKQIKDKIEKDLDLQAETFIEPDELMTYVNEAIDEAEAVIMKLYQDYFFTREYITLQTGIDEYTLPSNIYAHKIRSLIYNNNGIIYEIKRYRDWKKMINYTEDKQYSQGTIDRYFVWNSLPGGPSIIFSPPNQESGNLVTIWYIRNANRMTDDDSVCDIPEFVSFVIAYAKYLCMLKEGHPNLPEQEKFLEKQRIMMSETLADMIPDNENTIESDFSHYEEHN